MNKLKLQDFCRAAKLLGCEVAAIRAVAEVESRGDGFDSQGRVKILFERHKFYKYTDGGFQDSHPHLCNRESGGYGSERVQYAKFGEAFALDQKAALMSASWGKFQIMGFNYKVCGFDSVVEFVEAMKRGEAEQLLAFCRFVKSQKLARFLKTLDWARFASGYNGAGYRKNRYDEKMANFYAKFRKEKVDCFTSDLQLHKPDEQNQASAAILLPDADLQLLPAAPLVLAPIEPTSSEPAKDDFLAAAFDKNVSADQIKTALPSLGTRIWRYVARPLGLIYAALEAGNIAAWFGVTVAVVIVIYLIYAHRADIKKLFETLKNKFTQ